jgi:hypothetical protein
VKQLPQPVAIGMDILLAPVLLCAIVWVRARQAAILREGVALSVEEISLARTLGVVAAERVRVMAVDVVPMPLPRWARAIAYHTGLISPHIAGMTLGYGIVLRANCCGDARLLSHELVHVAQYERMGGWGGVGGFLRQYLRECVWPGYPYGALELEAQRAEVRAEVSADMSAEAGVLRARRM